MINRDVKILVIDPMATVTRLVASQLRSFGFNSIDQLHNASEAQGYVERGHYDLVLSEWDLGQVSGLELLKSVRANPLTKSLPFLLMTAEIEVDRVIEARQAGVSGYLVKPFSDNLLNQRITSVLARG